VSVLSAVGGLKEKAPYLTTGMRTKKNSKVMLLDSLYLTNPWIEVEVGTEYCHTRNLKSLVSTRLYCLWVWHLHQRTNWKIGARLSLFAINGPANLRGRYTFTIHFFLSTFEEKIVWSIETILINAQKCIHWLDIIYHQGKCPYLRVMDDSIEGKYTNLEHDSPCLCYRFSNPPTI